MFLSLEPATISGRFYPELFFQQGETAFGKPIVGRTTPAQPLHGAWSASYDQKIGAHTLPERLYCLQLAIRPLGPEAFPHRPSASENPLAPLGHHLEDSTHIAWDVVTGGVGFSAGQLGLRLEGSGTHGREPDENRWHIEVGAVDSWSARLSIAPGKDWVGQYSLGHLHSPEALHPQEDVLRQTASIGYHHAWSATSLDALAIWGRNHTIGTTEVANGYLAEGHAACSEAAFHLDPYRERRSDDRTFWGAAAPPEETVIGRVQAYTGGYAHRLWGWSDGWTELGAQYTGYNTPSNLVSLYGQHPLGVAAIFKVQLGRGVEVSLGKKARHRSGYRLAVALLLSHIPHQSE